MTVLLKHLSKIFAVILGLLLIILLVIFAESYSRSMAKKSIPVQLIDVHDVQISAYVKPDLFWSGESWWIDINSTSDLTITIDNKWAGQVPAGKTMIYGNHDSNNTLNFSTTLRRKTPSSIRITQSIK